MKTLIKGIFQFIVTIFILSIVVFYKSRLSPGDPLKAYYGDSVERMGLEQREKAIDNLGLNKPIIFNMKVRLIII